MVLLEARVQLGRRVAGAISSPKLDKDSNSRSRAQILINLILPIRRRIDCYGGHRSGEEKDIQVTSSSHGVIAPPYNGRNQADVTGRGSKWPKYQSAPRFNYSRSKSRFFGSLGESLVSSPCLSIGWVSRLVVGTSLSTTSNAMSSTQPRPLPATRNPQKISSAGARWHSARRL